MSGIPTICAIIAVFSGCPAYTILAVTSITSITAVVTVIAIIAMLAITTGAPISSCTTHATCSAFISRCEKTAIITFFTRCAGTAIYSITARTASFAILALEPGIPVISVCAIDAIGTIGTTGRRPPDSVTILAIVRIGNASTIVTGLAFRSGKPCVP